MSAGRDLLELLAHWVTLTWLAHLAGVPVSEKPAIPLVFAVLVFVAVSIRRPAFGLPPSTRSSLFVVVLLLYTVAVEAAPPGLRAIGIVLGIMVLPSLVGGALSRTLSWNWFALGSGVAIFIALVVSSQGSDSPSFGTMKAVAFSVLWLWTYVGFRKEALGLADGPAEELAVAGHEVEPGLDPSADAEPPASERPLPRILLRRMAHAHGDSAPPIEGETLESRGAAGSSVGEASGNHAAPGDADDSPSPSATSAADAGELEASSPEALGPNRPPESASGADTSQPPGPTLRGTPPDKQAVPPVCLHLACAACSTTLSPSLEWFVETPELRVGPNPNAQLKILPREGLPQTLVSASPQGSNWVFRAGDPSVTLDTVRRRAVSGPVAVLWNQAELFHSAKRPPSPCCELAAALVPPQGVLSGHLPPGRRRAPGIYTFSDARGAAPVTLRRAQFSRESDRVRFLQEARRRARVEHPSLQALPHLGERSVFVEWAAEAGDTLEQVIKRAGAFDAERVLALATQLSRGLLALHEAGVVHGSMTPREVLIHSTGDAQLCLGISALEMDLASDAPVRHLGENFALSYYAPEVLDNALNANAASDVYSLCAVLCNAVHGAPPFPGKTTRALIMGVLNDPPLAICPPLPAVFATGMAKSPEDRPSLEALCAALAGEALGHATNETFRLTDLNAAAPAPDQTVRSRWK